MVFSRTGEFVALYDLPWELPLPTVIPHHVCTLFRQAVMEDRSFTSGVRLAMFCITCGKEQGYA